MKETVLERKQREVLELKGPYRTSKNDRCFLMMLV